MKRTHLHTVITHLDYDGATYRTEYSCWEFDTGKNLHIASYRNNIGCGSSLDGNRDRINAVAARCGFVFPW